MNVAELIQDIALQQNYEGKVERLNRLRREIEASFPGKKIRLLIPLLYESNTEIRKEAAYLLQDYGVTLQGADYYQFCFALQDFDWLIRGHFDDPQARSIIFNGFRDFNLRLRARLLSYIHESDCRSSEERILYYYGRADYDLLIRLAQDSELQHRIIELLKYGAQEHQNCDYHRRQCAQALEMILDMDQLSSDIKALLSPPGKSRPEGKLEINRREIGSLSELDLLIHKLNSRGIQVENQRLFPQIHIGTVTGRITYKNPALQTWPSGKRLQAIQPFSGYEIIRFDYAAIEPRLLLNFLLQDHLLSMDDIPREDIYLAVYPDDRDAAKQYLNRLINGGSITPPFNPKPFLWKLVAALDEYKTDLRARLQSPEGLCTLAERPVDVDLNAANCSGKLVNRLVQGGASDLFNNALVEIDRYVTANEPRAEIYFLLYDEVWLLVNSENKERVNSTVLEILNRQWRHFGLLLPIMARQK